MNEQDQPERNHRHGCVVGGDHPGHALDARVELAVELRQRQHDDRGVRKGDRDRRRDEHGEE